MADGQGLKGRANGQETNKQGPKEKACNKGLKGAACGQRCDRQECDRQGGDRQGCDRQGPMGRG